MIEEADPPYEGKAAFNAWVDHNLRTMRIAWAAADGTVNPVAFLATKERMRTFAPDDDETLGQYIDRLTREARVVQARWFFICQRTHVGHIQSDEMMDAASAEIVQKAIDEGALKLGMVWYAERREGRITHRAGYMTAVGNRLSEPEETSPEQSFEPFAEVLGKIKG